jgi:four helix bundle protein
MEYKSLDTLELYQMARFFRKRITDLASTFPKEERYLLVAQIKDSARSITANIAEGYGRYYYQDAIKFYRISRGSLLETMDHLSSALDESYVNDTTFTGCKQDQENLLKKLNSYIAYIKRLKDA